MELTIDDQLRKLIPLSTFQKTWHLPADFGVAQFEPKDWAGLGSMSGSGPALNQIKQALIQSIPTTISPPQLMMHVDALGHRFRVALEAANEQIGLRPVEVDFAVAGLEDIMRDVTYRLIQWQHRPPAAADSSGPIDFGAIYQHWLDNGTRVAVESKIYDHEGQTFHVNIIYNPYGRVGLKVKLDEQVYYVADPALACPAAAFMETLAEEVSLALSRAVTGLPAPDNH
jgi:hypothetical protein